MQELTEPVALEIHGNKWYLHEISNDPSNTLGREYTYPVFDPGRFGPGLSLTL